MATKFYTKQFAGLLPDIYSVENHFARTFGGTLQVVDGVSDSDNFISVKTSDSDVVIQEYDTGANVAFGTGTGNSSRFGPRREIKSIDKQIAYEAPLSIHEGVDNVTVNDVPAQVIAERLEEQGKAWTEHLNGVLAKKLSDNASETLDGELTKEGVSQVFAEARELFVNNKVSRTLNKVAYVNAKVYNLLLEHNLTTTAKNSTTNIDSGEVRRFKGFELVEIADEYFEGDENIYFTVDNVGQLGVGIQMTRTIDAEDFYGVAIQSLAKYGVYLPEKNYNAVLKATLTEVAEG